MSQVDFLSVQDDSVYKDDEIKYLNKKIDNKENEISKFEV